MSRPTVFDRTTPARPHSAPCGGAPLARLPRARALGHRRRAARVAGRGARPTYFEPTDRPATSSRRRRRAPARPRSPCAGERAARAARTIERSPSWRRPNTQDAVGRGRGAGGIHLDPVFSNCHGRARPALPWGCRHVRAGRASAALHSGLTDRRATLVILDEVHHGGDALSAGATRCARRSAAPPGGCSLTGTPFRSDTAPIPFVSYLPDARGHPHVPHRLHLRLRPCARGRRRAAGAVHGLRRPDALAHQGRRGDGAPARRGNTKDITAQAWRTALDPDGDWIPAVLRPPTSDSPRCASRFRMPVAS